MSDPVKVTAVLTPLPGKAEALRALLLDMAPHCRAEPGNLRWNVWQERAEPARLVLDELYVDRDAVAAHRATDHYLGYLARVGDLAERLALEAEAVDVA